MRLLRRRAVIITLFGVCALFPVTARADARKPWATVNVCDTAAAPNTIGIRAWMPGSSSGKQQRSVRFIVQYLTKDNHWEAVAAGVDRRYVPAGTGRKPVELGRSFRIDPMPGEHVRLRGRVIFKWRAHNVVVHKVAVLTTRGHRSSAGADPADFSAPDCLVS
jgi:hypothetical protein